MIRAIMAGCLCLLAGVAAQGASKTLDKGTADKTLSTVAEQSGFKVTGRYDEVERLCAAFQQAWPSQVRCFEFGRSPEGRRMLALAVSADGTLDAASARSKQRAVVLMQGGIHSGEIDGKDAGFLALREMLQGKAANGALAKVTLVFVPVFSVDAHERFGHWNRPNQVGPEEMGWRVTAQNLNLNRDYAKAEAPEMHAMLRLLSEWDPLLYVDLHVTDGAKFEHDISFNIAPTLAGDTELVRAAVGLRDELMRKAKAQGSLPLDFYPSFLRDDDPQSGFAVAVSPIRFSQEYWPTHNRLAVLVETHSWKDYPTRVRITRNSIVDMMEIAAANAGNWQSVTRGADQRATQIGGTNVTLVYGNTDHKTMIDFRGYEYTREPSAISGALMTRYNDKRPQVWHIPLYDQLKPLVSIVAPKGGYVVPAAQAAEMQQKFALHGIESRVLATALPKASVQTFRASKATPAAATFEGRTTLTVEGDWKNEARDIPAGSLFVPIAQRNSQLVLKLLEPKDPDSFLSWGFFNAFFERKEYMEAYVAEDVAVQILKKDPAAKQEFERRLAEDPEFAKSAAARLDFFYQRSPSWDERWNLYPIYRTDAAL